MTARNAGFVTSQQEGTYTVCMTLNPDTVDVESLGETLEKLDYSHIQALQY